MNFTYDNNGNIYITKDNNYYMITINKNDDIELEKVLRSNQNGEPDISNVLLSNQNGEPNISDLNKINKQNILHIKTIENAIAELDENDDDEEKDKFNDIYDKYNSYIYNPEQRFYQDDDTEQSDDDYDYVNFVEKERQIKLYSSSIIKQTDFSFDIPIYEILIISGDIGTNNLIFRTKIINDQALYRLTLYTSGVILLNIIGTKIIKFIINQDTLEISKDHYQNINS